MTWSQGGPHRSYKLCDYFLNQTPKVLSGTKLCWKSLLPLIHQLWLFKGFHRTQDSQAKATLYTILQIFTKCNTLNLNYILLVNTLFLLMTILPTKKSSFLNKVAQIKPHRHNTHILNSQSVSTKQESQDSNSLASIHWAPVGTTQGHDPPHPLHYHTSSLIYTSENPKNPTYQMVTECYKYWTNGSHPVPPSGQPAQNNWSVYRTTPSQMRALLSSFSSQMVPQEPLVAWQKPLVIFVLVSLPVLQPYTSWESYLGQG